MSSDAGEDKLFSQENVTLLLSLIAGGSILNKRKVDTSTNKAESTAEWKKFANAFNDTFGTSYCTLQLLRQKWADLKTNATLRNYNTSLLPNSKKDLRDKYYFELILNEVGALLAKSDEEPHDIVDIENPTQINNHACQNNVMPRNNIPEKTENREKTNSPIFHTKSSVKRKSLKSSDGQIARNIAFLKYHKVKRSFLESKIENIKLRNTKLKYEIIKLKNEVHDIIIEESMCS